MKRIQTGKSLKVLVIDVGGTNIKLLATGQKDSRKIASGSKIVEKLRTALEADYVVLGGGNVKKLKKLPPGTRLGNNQNAFLGGFRMWADSQTASNLKNA